ncbi:MAG: hypothetical protein AB7D06_11655 [Pedobacter sp.]
MDLEKTHLKVCPLVGNPSRECYFLQMDDRNIQKVIDYCTGMFAECAIFRSCHLAGEILSD